MGGGAGFYEGHKVFRGGDWGDQSSPTEFKGGRLQKMDFHLTSNEGGEWGGGGQINFIVTKPNTPGTPPSSYKNNT